LKSDSAIDLGSENILEAGSSIAESGIDLVAEDAIMQEGPRSSDSGSSRDLSAEGLESGIDLDVEEAPSSATTPKKKAGAGSGESDWLEEFSRATASNDDSSAVDLGSVASMPVFEMDKSKQQATPPPAPSDSAPIDEDEGIELDMTADVEISPKKKSAAA